MTELLKNLSKKEVHTPDGTNLGYVQGLKRDDNGEVCMALPYGSWLFPVGSKRERLVPLRKIEKVDLEEKIIFIEEFECMA